MADKPTPTDAELKAMWQLHAADIGGIFDFARAALAKWGQPAQATKCECTMAQRCTGSGCRYCNPQEYIDMLHDQIAENEPAQAAEPVAWVWRFSDGSFCETPFETQKACAQDAIGYEGEPVPLYLAPQPVAREQLTRERVKEIVRGAGYDQCGIPDTERAAFINGLRHGEVAHGIKGGQHGDAKP